MGTAFSAFANGEIIFKTSTGDSTEDQYGNKVFNLRDYKVKCFLKQARRPSSDLTVEYNQNEIYVEGRCIDPRTYPDDVRPETLYKATIDGREYSFRFEPSIQSPFYKENRILGQRIRGYLITTTIWQDG